MGGTAAKIPDPYKTLGVGKNSTSFEIKKAYLRLALIHHPDKHPNLDSEALAKITQQFCEIEQAYALLKNPKHRVCVDHAGEFGFDGTSGESIEAVCEKLFGPLPAKTPLKLSDNVVKIHVTPGERMSGIVKEVHFQRQVIDQLKFNALVLGRNNCRTCRGTGYTSVKNAGGGRDKFRCQECSQDVRSVTYVEDIVEMVAIPAGSAFSTEIRYQEMGDEADGAINGDMVFIVVPMDDMCGRGAQVSTHASPGVVSDHGAQASMRARPQQGQQKGGQAGTGARKQPLTHEQIQFLETGNIKSVDDL